jgi:hypothetical protein
MYTLLLVYAERADSSKHLNTYKVRMMSDWLSNHLLECFTAIARHAYTLLCTHVSTGDAAACNCSSLVVMLSRCIYVLLCA